MEPAHLDSWPRFPQSFPAFSLRYPDLFLPVLFSERVGWPSDSRAPLEPPRLFGLPSSSSHSSSVASSPELTLPSHPLLCTVALNERSSELKTLLLRSPSSFIGFFSDTSAPPSALLFVLLPDANSGAAPLSAPRFSWCSFFCVSFGSRSSGRHRNQNGRELGGTGLHKTADLPSRHISKVGQEAMGLRARTGRAGKQGGMLAHLGAMLRLC